MPRARELLRLVLRAQSVMSRLRCSWLWRIPSAQQYGRSFVRNSWTASGPINRPPSRDPYESG